MRLRHLFKPFLVMCFGAWSVGTLAVAAETALPVAVLWEDARVDALAGAVPAGIGQALTDAGYSVRPADTAVFEADILAKADALLLVLPYGGLYPAASAKSLDAYLREGGSMLCLGGTPFTEPVFAKAGNVHYLTAGTAREAAIPLTPPWPKGHASTGVAFRMEPAEDGMSAQVSVDGFSGYGYIGTTPPELPYADAVLCFETRAITATPRLCAELAARDGSRWKYVVPLSPAWTEHRIHLADFVSYNSPARSGAEDYCRPNELRILTFGFTAPMVGPGDHRFDVRNVRFQEAVIDGATVRAIPRFERPGCSVKRWFGDPAADERLLPRISLADERRRVTGSVLAAADASLPFGERTQEGPWAGTALRAKGVSRSSGNALANALAEASEGPFLPVLTLDGDVVVGALAPHGEGPYAGSSCAFFTVESSNVSESSLLRDAFVYTATLIREGVMFCRLEPEFAAVEGRAVLTPVLTLRNLSVSDRHVSVQASVTSHGANHDFGVRECAVPPGREGETVAVRFDPLGLNEFDWHNFVLEARADGVPGHAFFGNLRFSLDTGAALKTVCDFLSAHFNEHGRLHGNRFIENRGMRTLLAGYELFGEQAYRDAAMRWAEEVVMADQRDDGGYRMGYGITSKGESCYVADGGEIAVCIARLVSYAKGAQRDALLESLDSYMAYRESFRVPEGGIGVGWCLHDYGQRPVVPLDEPTRIYAPERNTYTIGCTLAAAYAHARMRNDPALEERAEKDAEWLMPRTEVLHGAFVESYLYAHMLTTDPGQQERYETYLREAFRDRMLAPTNKTWWLRGGGRSALNLDGLAYWLHAIAPDDAEIQAMMATAVCSMFSPEGEHSILRLVEEPALAHDAWIYICYGSLGLADVVRPMVSMENLVPARGSRKGSSLERRSGPGCPACYRNFAPSVRWTLKGTG